MISLNQVNEYLSLSQSDQLTYRFTAVEEPLSYNHNPIGYAILIRISTIIFGSFMGDLQAVQFFQLCFHILISVLIINFFKERRTASLIFLFLYALNPFIIYFTVFNFYYFWQVLPSAAVIVYLYNRSLFNHSGFRIILSIFFALLLLTRLTLILIVILLLIFMVYEDFIRKREKKFFLRFATSLLPFFLLFFLLNVPDDKSVYHTIFVGAGAYSNDLGLHLEDSSGYDLIERRENIKLNIHPGENYYDPEITLLYNSILKEEVWYLITNHPVLLIRNATLNFGQSFFIGFRPGAGDLMNTLLSISGYLILLFFLLMKNRRIWLLLLSITCYSVTYVLYFPPIQSYHYGAYLLILFLFIEFADKSNVLQRLRLHTKFF